MSTTVIHGKAHYHKGRIAKTSVENNMRTSI
jgi:hypothetical protein